MASIVIPPPYYLFEKQNTNTSIQKVNIPAQ